MALRTMTPFPVLLGALVALAALSGCASYHRVPLAQHADLAPGLASLDLRIPAAGGQGGGRTVDITRPLGVDEIGLLAIANNTGLKSQRGIRAAARAGVVQARLLPDPSVNFGYGALVGGPGTAASIAASLAQDIAAIVTRGARLDAAKAHLAAVDANQLWREWQVAQKARQLAVDLYWDGKAIGLLASEVRLISAEAKQVRSAIAAGNLTLTALAPLLTAAAAAEQSLTGLRLGRLKNRQALDGLLGLSPRVRFTIARPRLPPPPADAATLIAALPQRRPDLVALRLGYRAAEADVRAAILGQFPSFQIGVSYGSDTTKVVTIGPAFTFALPVFDRNQGKIAASRATRLRLREQYQARLDAAVANAQALLQQLHRLGADLGPARKAAAAANSLAATARRAYARHNFDQRSLTDYETTALERAVQVTAIERKIAEDRVMLAVELGEGLPRAHLALRKP